MIPALTERFWSKVDISSDCWVWTAHRDRDGYGTFSLTGRSTTIRAHRAAFAAEHGIDLDAEAFKGVPLDHLCRNRACVRPSHLEIVTPKINCSRGLKATQTHCINGHEFTEANTYRKPNGTRSCRTCHKVREQQRRNASRK